MKMPTIPVAGALLALLVLCLPARGDEVEIEKWGSAWMVDRPEEAVILLYDTSAGKLKQMELLDFLVDYEESIADEIPLVHAMQANTTPQSIPSELETSVEFNVTVQEAPGDPDMHQATSPARLVAPRHGKYRFHAVIELEPSASDYSYYAAVKKSGGGVGQECPNHPPEQFYAYHEHNEAIRDLGASTPDPPSDDIIRVVNLSGVVCMSEGQYLELIVWHNSDVPVSPVLDKCSPSMYMRRLRD